MLAFNCLCFVYICLCVCVRGCVFAWVCLAVLSGFSAEDCAVYRAHGQTGLALLQWGAPLLKFRLLKVVGKRLPSFLFLFFIYCVHPPLHTSHSHIFGGGSKASFPSPWESLTHSFGCGPSIRVCDVMWVCPYHHLLPSLYKSLHEEGWLVWRLRECHHHHSHFLCMECVITIPYPSV